MENIIYVATREEFVNLVLELTMKGLAFHCFTDCGGANPYKIVITGY